MRLTGMILLLVCLIFPAFGQEAQHTYMLEEGARYYLIQELHQDTETENMELAGNVSLDIRFRLEMEVTGVDPGKSYNMSCSYSGLELNFFSPGSGYTISSRSGEFTPIKAYLQLLEELEFSIQMSATGEILQVNDLDSSIMATSYSGENNIAGNEPIRKTIMEAFGSEALKSLSAILLDICHNNNGSRCTRNNTIYFNARPVEINNTLYSRKSGEDQVRVQGVGVISETTMKINLEKGSLVIMMKGSQTYDYLTDRETGWIISGVSKQKIHSISRLEGHESLPDGLKVPSYTNSEYDFRGGMVEDEAGRSETGN